MATVRELLEQRTQELGELLDQIREETQGDINLERLTQLSDELGARADNFAQTLSSAREALEGGAQEQDEDAEEGDEPEQSEGSFEEAQGAEDQGDEGDQTAEPEGAA